MMGSYRRLTSPWNLDKRTQDTGFYFSFSPLRPISPPFKLQVKKLHRHEGTDLSY